VALGLGQQLGQLGLVSLAEGLLHVQQDLVAHLVRRLRLGAADEDDGE
jgi:hypothetical protein